MNQINEFQGEYRWLSNFWPCNIEYEGIVYPSTEHAYQAAKTPHVIIRKIIASNPEPRFAKRIGKSKRVQIDKKKYMSFDIRPDWDSVRYGIMYELIQLKFFFNEELKKKLLDTGDAKLIEGNYWNDTYWGICRGVGENNLGKILMNVRAEINKINQAAREVKKRELDYSDMVSWQMGYL